MRIQTLVTAIDQTDHTLAEKMNLQTDALIGNQCDREGTETITVHGCQVTYLNAKDRGVGINRNRLLDNAEGELLVLADDDMRFVDGYREIVEKAVQVCEDADVYIFNLIEKNPRRFINRTARRIGRSDFARYGAARLMLRRESILRAGLRFSTEFGGGARYGSGEDTIFLHDCLKKRLKVYAVPLALAEIDQDAPSTWFTGYHELFFRDKGALYACLYPRIWLIMALRFLVVHRRRFSGSITFGASLKAMVRGGKTYIAERKDRV